MICFFKRRQTTSQPVNPTQLQGNTIVVQQQVVQHNLSTNQYLETEYKETLPSCPSYPPDDFNAGYQHDEISANAIPYQNVMGHNQPPYAMHNPFQSY